MATLVDPSWLPSTVAQSTAALVGIIGGLLVGRFVGLDAEQRAADLRLTEAKERRDAARLERDQLAAQIEELEVADVLFDDDVMDLLVERQGEATAEEVLDKVDTDLSEEVLRPHLTAAIAAVVETTALCQEKLPQDEAVGSFDWDEVRGYWQMTKDRWDPLRERAFEAVAKEKSAAAWAAKRSAQRRAAGSGPLGNLLAGAGLSDPMAGFATVAAPPRLSAPRTWPAGLLQQSRTAESRFLASELEVMQAQRAVDRTQTPPGLLRAVGVLTLLTFVGLVWPVVALYAEPAYHDEPRRLGVLVAFICGLAVLLTYLWAYAIKLSNRGRARRPTKPPSS